MSNRCFISYSWDSESHKNWVLRLAEELHKNGVYVHLDQWDAKPGMDLPQYMETCIRESGFVLLICTPGFAQKADRGVGGVGFEKTIVTGEIFLGVPSATKFVPILRSGAPVDAMPSYLKSKYFIDMRSDSEFAERIDVVLRHIYDAPVVARPDLGSAPKYAKPPQISPSQRNEGVGVGASANVRLPTEKPGKFDIERFQQLRDFALGVSGLDLSSDGAKRWATEHLADNPPFDIERFRQLRDFALSVSGLDLSSDGAKRWAISHLADNPPFDIERFRQLRDFALSVSGLDLSSDGAKRWATSHLADSPPFDVERFRQLRDFALSVSGLDLSSDGAKRWALAELEKERK